MTTLNEKRDDLSEMTHPKSPHRSATRSKNICLYLYACKPPGLSSLTNSNTTIATMPSITTLRTVALYIPCLSGSLSILGSSSIIYSIYKQRKVKLKDPQHRILLGMSIFDIFYSLCKALTFLLYPSGYGIPAFGNLSSCRLQGFFTQFSYSVGLYNLVLSLYYYLTIVKGMKRREFSHIIEKCCHGFIVILTLTFASVGAGIGLFNPTPAFCYIAPFPYGCTRTNTCTRFGDSFGIFCKYKMLSWFKCVATSECASSLIECPLSSITIIRRNVCAAVDSNCLRRSHFHELCHLVVCTFSGTECAQVYSTLGRVGTTKDSYQTCSQSIGTVAAVCGCLLVDMDMGYSIPFDYLDIRQDCLLASTVD